MSVEVGQKRRWKNGREVVVLHVPKGERWVVLRSGTALPHVMERHTVERDSEIVPVPPLEPGSRWVTEGRSRRVLLDVVDGVVRYAWRGTLFYSQWKLRSRGRTEFVQETRPYDEQTDGAW